MEKPDGPLEAIGDAIGKVATFGIMAAIVAVTVGTGLAVRNLLNRA